MIIEETKWLLDYGYSIELIINASNGHHFTAEVKVYKILKFDNDLGKPIYQVKGHLEDCFTYNLNKATVELSNN